MKINRILLLAMLICLPLGLFAQGTISRPKKPKKQTSVSARHKKQTSTSAKQKKQTSTSAKQKKRPQASASSSDTDGSVIFKEYPNSSFARLMFWSPNKTDKEFRIEFECDWNVHPDPNPVKKLAFNVLWVGGNWSSPINTDDWTVTAQNPWIIQKSQSNDSRVISFVSQNSQRRIEIHTKPTFENSTLRIYSGAGSPVQIYPIRLTKDSWSSIQLFISRIVRLGYATER